MTTTAQAGPTRDNTFFGHPRGLATLFFTEMWERFSYYGMRALLILFMVTATDAANPGLELDVATAGAIYGLYTSLVYILALPGGWVADNLWGQQKAIWVGGWIIALGHFTMAIPTTDNGSPLTGSHSRYAATTTDSGYLGRPRVAPVPLVRLLMTSRLNCCISASLVMITTLKSLEKASEYFSLTGTTQPLFT